MDGESARREGRDGAVGARGIAGGHREGRRWGSPGEGRCWSCGSSFAASSACCGVAWCDVAVGWGRPHRLPVARGVHASCVVGAVVLVLSRSSPWGALVCVPWDGTRQVPYGQSTAGASWGWAWDCWMSSLGQHRTVRALREGGREGASVWYGLCVSCLANLSLVPSGPSAFSSWPPCCCTPRTQCPCRLWSSRHPGRLGCAGLAGIPGIALRHVVVIAGTAVGCDAGLVALRPSLASAFPASFASSLGVIHQSLPVPFTGCCR